jgi:hypothetical protein
MRHLTITEKASALPATVAEKKSVQALIHYQADQRGLCPGVIERAAECFLGVDDLSRLPAHSYDAAIRFLVDFPGVN